MTRSVLLPRLDEPAATAPTAVVVLVYSLVHVIFHIPISLAVSYTHLTLPTIYSV